MQATAVLAPRSPRILPLSRLGDESLASRAAAGNQAAFAALYERYHGPLLGYCRSILLDAEDALDATQSALENALRALPRREPGRPLRPWLYRIAHNEAINIVRRRQPLVAHDFDAAELLTVPGPEADSEQRTRLAQLVDDLRLLPERQRGALVMRELSGLSYDEIGGALGISNEAARRAVFDARTALHDAVDGRATECTSVRRTLSDGDRRRLRARGVRAHLRSCDDCATFERSMGARQADLHALGSLLGGSAALGLLSLGAGGSGGSALVGSGGAVVASGGSLWAGLPAAVKGLAVAAVVAGGGTAAVELPQVTAHDAPARTAQAASASGASGATLAPAAISRRHDALHEQALAQAAAARHARRARARAASRANAAQVSTGTGSVSHATIARPAPARPTVPAVPVAPPAASRPATGVASSPARTAEQIAQDNLQRIQDKVQNAFTSAQTIAHSGVEGALQTANQLIQSAIDQVMPALENVLATLGLPMPSWATTTSTSPTTTTQSTSLSNILAPAQTLLDGVTAVLQNLFGRR